MVKNPLPRPRAGRRPSTDKGEADGEAGRVGAHKHPLRVVHETDDHLSIRTAYFELDLAGNVRRLRAEGGADLGGYRYSAFGKTLENTVVDAAFSDQPLRWKGRWHYSFGGVEVYDMRARQWCPELGTFLSVDNYRYHDTHSTLWGWSGQNPVRWRDPSGHDPGGGDALVFSQMDDRPSIAEQQSWDVARGQGAALGFATLLGMVEIEAAVQSGALANAVNSVRNWLFGAPAAATATKTAADKAQTCSIDEAAMQAARNACPGGQCNDMANALIKELGQGRLVQLLPNKGDGLLPTTNPNLGWYQHTAVVTNAGEVLDPFTSTSYASIEAWRTSVVGAADVLTLIDGAVTR